jgi:thiosulfate reductase cytochrome b subunit
MSHSILVSQSVVWHFFFFFLFFCFVLLLGIIDVFSLGWPYRYQYRFSAAFTSFDTYLSRVFPPFLSEDRLLCFFSSLVLSLKKNR